jgi:RNA polymerase sigma-70 factor, ECF subfamily
VNPGQARPDEPVDLSPVLAAARMGDEAAFAVLYRAVQPGLLRYLQVLVGQDAQDVASEVWLQIARDLRGYRGDGGGVRAWAASIARHRALDHLRRQSRRPAQAATLEHLDHLADGQDTAAEAVETVSTQAALALIATLPREQAEAILLRVVVGLDAESAARVLGKRAGAVRTAAYRGLRRLAERLNQSATISALAPEATGRPAGNAPAAAEARPIPAATISPVTRAQAVAPKDSR